MPRCLNQIKFNFEGWEKHNTHVIYITLGGNRKNPVGDSHLFNKIKSIFRDFKVGIVLQHTDKAWWRNYPDAEMSNVDTGQKQYVCLSSLSNPFLLPNNFAQNSEKIDIIF